MTKDKLVFLVCPVLLLLLTTMGLFFKQAALPLYVAEMIIVITMAITATRRL